MHKEETFNQCALTINGYKSEVKKTYELPGDKSVGHRSLLIGALPKGEYKIRNFPQSRDCLTTLKIMEELGVKVKVLKDYILVNSPGYENFKKKIDYIDCGNSGTTSRLIAGILAGVGVETNLVGDKSLSIRPMKRIVDPLNSMGANIEMEKDHMPLIFKGNGELKGIDYTMEIASAQVKSCILLAGFLSEGVTKVRELSPTRDHTERMLKYIEGNIKIENKEIEIENSTIKSKDIYVPGDISSAAYIIACAILGEDCEIILENVLLNENRRKYLDLLKKMGANLKYLEKNQCNGEHVGNILVKSSFLKGISIGKEITPYIIDEIPIISLIASFAEGKTIFENVEELKYKESDRIKAIMVNLKSLGVKTELVENNLIIYGGLSKINKEINIRTFNDHRIALTFLCSAMRNSEKTYIDNWDCVAISFPNSLNYFKDFFRIN
ncbi:3-phosphoshikimate 1-carboxyvinyltransferase [Clostridium tetani]|uniref:3-phosphoshikimate 1-carboxyvinyltransferase n=1 Tax=Clostridium tetani (strain Massachusetts / E88) TaxID=212717 RepID=AROA_CLOTE|nr:3-phosphoshikimate 1-carboxyvinyltransferase [Clostridium tetani]Q894D2.1 RecName: Full=3-phosphoshikimate 1-carboxyvinyltransferase; AltName: Full=5-enolpyruvylshikimate-3-phosphate synthase; Short=EPSP synthase; Short=EPSPS [Clostridium tetani E88]AAO36160.1 3-phosphoshikimate 1-carboxyvinyltransferase [Clostridium tetani E88]QBD85133.1 3-phosphoshikimate 1-carboxyvinyltransferase [Clostridium tetani]QBD87484.1 3-phosphoshikimate 1-carboxyvinyltransferase [Clostridium tetani]RXI62038.1 3-